MNYSSFKLYHEGILNFLHYNDLHVKDVFISAETTGVLSLDSNERNVLKTNILHLTVVTTSWLANMVNSTRTIFKGLLTLGGPLL